MKAQSVLATIGNTPHIRINRIFGAACQSHQIYIKSERSNPGGSIKDRIAQKLVDIPAGSTVLGFNYDTGERYLSVEGFLP